MLRIEGKQIEAIDLDYLKREPDVIINTLNFELYSGLSIKQSIIDRLDLPAFLFHSEVVIRDCIIKEVQLSYCWFINGLEFTNNTILQEATFEAGGHNKKPFIMKENIFHGFLNFFDCQFGDTVYFSNNTLLEGCNLLGNKGEGYETLFDNGIIQNGNTGRLDME